MTDEEDVDLDGDVPVSEASELTESGQADYFAEQYKDTVRFVHATRTWWAFRGNRWTRDRGGLIPSLIHQSIQRRASALASTPEGLKFLGVLGRHNTRIGVQREAERHHILGRADMAWNPNPDLLGVENGVVDLTTGKMVKPKPEQLINMSTGIDYIPWKELTKERRAKWEKFVFDIMNGDQEMANYLQRALGYSTTGRTEEHKWFVCYNSQGRNGKSLLLEKTVLPALGEYACKALKRTFIEGAPEGKGELSVYEGKRFVYVPEMEGVIRSARVKEWSQGGLITDVPLYTNNKRNFPAVMKMWMDTNHLPQVHEDAKGFWERVCRINFDRVFKLNPAFERGMTEDLEVVLSWLVSGAIGYYQAKSLDPTPAKVSSAVEDYEQISASPVVDFINTLVPTQTAKTPAKALYGAYRRWAFDQGFMERDMLKPQTFARKLYEMRPSSRKMISGTPLWKLEPGGSK